MTNVYNIGITRTMPERQYPIILFVWKLARVSGPVISYKLRYIVGFGLDEMDISTNPKLAMYRNLYENRAQSFKTRFERRVIALYL